MTENPIIQDSVAIDAQHDQALRCGCGLGGDVIHGVLTTDGHWRCCNSITLGIFWDHPVACQCVACMVRHSEWYKGLRPTRSVWAVWIGDEALFLWNKPIMPARYSLVGGRPAISAHGHTNAIFLAEGVVSLWPTEVEARAYKLTRFRATGDREKSRGTKPPEILDPMVTLWRSIHHSRHPDVMVELGRVFGRSWGVGISEDWNPSKIVIEKSFVEAVRRIVSARVTIRKESLIDIGIRSGNHYMREVLAEERRDAELTIETILRKCARRFPA